MAVWLYGDHVTLEFRDELLAQYTVTYQPDGRQLRTVEAPLLFETPFHSPQLPLWALTDEEWRKVLRLTPGPTRRRRPAAGVQHRLFS